MSFLSRLCKVACNQIQVAKIVWILGSTAPIEILEIGTEPCELPLAASSQILALPRRQEYPRQ